MMQTLVLMLALASATAVELDATSQAQLSEQVRKGAVTRSDLQSYTERLGSSTLKARVQAEAQKVEKAQASHQSMAQIVSAANSMTQSARLQEMASLVEGGKGASMIKSLSADAKDALSGLQKMWLDVTASSLEKIAEVESALPRGVAAFDPGVQTANKKAFMPIETIVNPFMNHINALKMAFPELNPFTEKVQSMSSFLQKDSLENMFGSVLPGLQKYKKTFQTYKKEHQEHILDFMEKVEMDDFLTVLQSPEF